jgi:hypothetical protein
MGSQTDVVDVRTGAAVLDQEIGHAFDGKRADLADIGGIVEDTGGKGFVKLKGLIDELDRGNQHIVKGSRFRAQIKCRRNMRLVWQSLWAIREWIAATRCYKRSTPLESPYSKED